MSKVALPAIWRQVEFLILPLTLMGLAPAQKKTCFRGDRQSGVMLNEYADSSVQGTHSSS